MKDRNFIDNFLQEYCSVASRISRSEIEHVIEILYEAYTNEKNIYIMGNGGSASTATHFACDLAKWTIVEGKPRFRVICLNDNIPLLTALTNDNGFNTVFIEQLRGLLEKGDVVIVISVHGGSGQDKAGVWSQNLLAAVQYAKDNSAKTVGIAGFDGGALKKLADACIVVPVESTPYVESWHATLEHLICSCLKEKILQT